MDAKKPRSELGFESARVLSQRKTRDVKSPARGGTNSGRLTGKPFRLGVRATGLKFVDVERLGKA